MNHKFFLLSIVFFFFIFHSIKAQNQGEKIFIQQCAVCHTIGRGDLIGPDLINIQKSRPNDWIIQFIKSPQGIIDSGDSIANALFNEFHIVMPDQQLTDNEINSILSYIESRSALGANSSGTAPTEIFGSASYSSNDIATGKRIFEGKTKLLNGGPSCISCHNIDNSTVFTGGLLAKDLTTVNSRYGEAGVGGILNNPPFPAMIDAYKKAPITKEEINFLLAFLNYTNNNGSFSITPLEAQFDFLIGVIIISAIVLFIFLLLWNRVKKDSVNIKQLLQ